MLALFLASGFFAAVHWWSMPMSELIVMGLLLARIVSIFGKAQQSHQAAAQAESAYWAIHDTILEARAAHEESSGTRIPTLRSEERRVGKERVSTSRSRCALYH